MLKSLEDLKVTHFLGVCFVCLFLKKERNSIEPYYFCFIITWFGQTAFPPNIGMTRFESGLSAVLLCGCPKLT